MDILFASEKLERECCDSKLRRRRHGDERARRLQVRLDDLRAADNLAMMRTLPGKCHELTGDLDGCLAVSLDGPYRLIFEPANEPVPMEGRRLLWEGVTIIRILRIEDYHHG